MASHLGIQFGSDKGTVGPLGNSTGAHHASPDSIHAPPMSKLAGDTSQGQYVGKHRAPSERWNPGNATGFSEEKYQSSYSQNPKAGGAGGDPDIPSVQFTRKVSPGVHPHE
jgi:hypothetical protein